ncbi:hypothetical protein [uncultured Brachyspira sp.]
METMVFITFIHLKQYITFIQLPFYFNVSASLFLYVTEIRI